MAFAALHFPMDKDHQSQLPSFWPDNDNELEITGDNFFDQFVTFDPGEAAAAISSGEAPDDDPPSPSILLDSLGHELSVGSPSDLLDLPPPPSLDETSAANTSRRHVAAAAAILPPQSSSAAGQQLDRGAFAPSAARDLVLSNGSISDSELLHLEGISLRSSPPRRTIVTAPSSPPPPPAASSSTPHQRQGQRSSSKHSNRFVEAGYATIRRAAQRLRFLPNQAQVQTHYQPANMADREGDTFLADARSGPPDVFTNGNYEEFGDVTAEAAIKREEAVDGNGLPLSPPLTGRIPDGYLTGPSAFVTGHLEDPFCDDMPGPTTANRHRDIDTPMSTPAIKGEATFHGQNQVIAPASLSSFRQHSHKPYRSTSSAEWPTEGLLADVKYGDEDATMWNSTSPSLTLSYTTAGETTTGPDWWQAEGSSTYYHHRGGVRGSNTAHVGISMHDQHQHQQGGDLPYEYSASVSGLMIQMPQPRPPQANGVLAAPATPTTAYRVHGSNSNITPTLSRSHAHHYQQQHQSQSHHHSKGGGHPESRRPRPRAPSSGARHHGAQSSPRKLHHSMSLGYLREEAQQQQHHQQTPSTPTSSSRHSHHQERRHQRSSSLTMRKQRSFTRRPNGTESRRTASTSTAGSGSCDIHLNEDNPTTTTTTTNDSSSSSSSAAAFSRGFVNYTPNDKNKLMAGVAPSGSSKTKLRREREALEKSRLISEMALKVAGGDVNPGVLKELMGNFSSP